MNDHRDGGYKPRFILECQHCSWFIDVLEADDLLGLPNDAQTHWISSHEPRIP